eukprot:scaffold348490_cov17-Prasinocladus_malaysianus.AAC.2
MYHPLEPIAWQFRSFPWPRNFGPVYLFVLVLRKQSDKLWQTAVISAGVLGCAGQRICDRAITSIAYFNKDWTEQDGGCLRVQKLDGSGHEDIAPRSGRLVIFMVTAVISLAPFYRCSTCMYQ